MSADRQLRALLLKVLAKIDTDGLPVGRRIVVAACDGELEGYLCITRHEPAEPERPDGQDARPTAVQTDAPEPTLNDVEQAVVQVLREHRTLTGPQIATLAGYPYEGRLREILAGLRRRGVLVNRAPGYALADARPNGQPDPSP
jgi:hypothetical protein